MNDHKLDSPKAIQTFLAGIGKQEFAISKENRLNWLSDKLRSTHYHRLKKGEKSIVRQYLQRATGYSRSHLTRLIAKHRVQGVLNKASGNSRHHFTSQYTDADVRLLAETDEAHQTLSGGTTKKLFERAYLVYGDNRFKRLANISISHLYNLRKGNAYHRLRRHFTKTKSNQVPIGTRRKPQPNNQPGYIRIDTVHQGDQDGKKGVYHINAVDEVTQYEIIMSVEKISENYLIPILEAILEQFPFVVQGFHSDYGSEYINYRVAKLLNKLHVEFTKSRARRCNDNALVEAKNGAIVRKQLGYMHIPQKWAAALNQFHCEHLNPYLNFHRPCHYPEVTMDNRGKEKKTYPYKNIMTPYEKLKSLDGAEKFLKVGITFGGLEHVAKKKSDLEAAKALQKARKQLFDTIFPKAKSNKVSIDNM